MLFEAVAFASVADRGETGGMLTPDNYIKAVSIQHWYYALIQNHHKHITLLEWIRGCDQLVTPAGKCKLHAHFDVGLHLTLEKEKLKMSYS